MSLRVDAPPHRVVVYVLDPEHRLLVFTQPGSPAAGVQVPAGSIEPDEQPLAAAHREVLEETGLACTPERVLLAVEQDLPRRGIFVNHFVLARCSIPERDVWTRRVQGSGTDVGLEFECGFSDLDIADITLGRLQAAGLEALHAALGDG